MSMEETTEGYAVVGMIAWCSVGKVSRRGNGHKINSNQTKLPIRHSMLSFFVCLFLFLPFSFCLLGLHLEHMDVPRLGVEPEL